jgi:hypothetical protein
MTELNAATRLVATETEKPGHGEVGSHEYENYGKYFRRGDLVKDNYGKLHTVREHRGPQVFFQDGGYAHPSKLHLA